MNLRCVIHLIVNHTNSVGAASAAMGRSAFIAADAAPTVTELPEAYLKRNIVVKVITR